MKNLTNWKRALVLGAVLTLALGAVACGDDSSDNGGPSGPYTCTSTAELGEVCTVSGTVTEDITFTADKSWVLRGGVFIGDDSSKTVLTIEPGTTIYGESSTDGMLVIRRGSQIMAEGTSTAPIVFTSSKAVGSRARGDWGGVILNGRATINACTEDGKTDGLCEGYGEGATGWFGGTDDADNSGVLRYVRIEFAGRIISPDNELNGLALQGVGTGTEIDFIQIHRASDDSIEFFGGAVNFKYVLTTGIDDDNLDWTDGWRGKGQFIVAQQYAGAGDNGIEADNNAENNTYTPRSDPTISNITLIGSPDSSNSDLGMLLREGTGATITNAIILGWNEACLSINNDETYLNAYNDAAGALSGELRLTHSIISCATPYTECVVGDTCSAAPPFTVADFYEQLNQDNQQVDPLLTAPLDPTTPDFTPQAGSPARSGAVVPSDPFFDQVSFLGGVDPDNDWTKGWTTTAQD